MLRDFSKEPFDILIQAGQSNAEGSGYGDTVQPYVPDPRILYLEPDLTISLARELVQGNQVRGNFSLTFAADYAAAGLLAPGRKLLILRTAVGGTGFLEGHWTPEGDLYQRMLAMTRTALALNPENRLIGLLWHQGERDSKLHASYEQHYHNFAALVQGLRDCFASPALPFVAGDLVQDWAGKNRECTDPVVSATRAVCQDLGGAFVSTQGLASNGELGCPHPFGIEYDDLHFCRPALYELGHRYFEAFLSLHP